VKKDDVLRKCKHHGKTPWYHVKGSKNIYKCRKCASDRVTKTRKKRRKLLVEEAGGKCRICGYDSYIGALQFHHVDPSEKEFGLSGYGQTYSLDRMRKEASKCVLLCANCHAEVEHGMTPCPAL
jgi:hypothetical protein